MKKITFLLTLAISSTFIASCGNKSTYTLEINTEYCFVEGIKERYSPNERVELNLRPYPYFELPAEKYIAIYGANDVDYDYANKKIAFTIIDNASLSFSAESTFNGKPVGLDIANKFFNNASKNPINVHYRYAFDKVDDTTSDQLIMELINCVYKLEEGETGPLKEFSGEITLSNPDEIGNNFLNKKIFGESDTYYISNKLVSEYAPKSGEELFLYSNNARINKNISGVTACAHYRGGDAVYCDYIYFSFENVIAAVMVDDYKTWYSKPINGFMELDIVCTEEITPGL